MASNNNRERLIRTFMARTNTGRRKQRGPLDQGFPSSSGPAGYKPQKQGTLIGKTNGSGSTRPQDLAATKQYAAQQARKRKQARY